VLAVIALSLSCAPGAMAASTGEISGTVTNTSAEPIEGIEVCAYSEATEDFILECTTTKSNGKYTIAGLPSGEYEVEFLSPSNSTLNYITQYWEYKSSFSEATLVPVGSGETPNIDAELHEGGQITGAVRNAAGNSAHGPIVGIEVCASSEKAGGSRCATTNAGGEYNIVGLATGSYTVEFLSPSESLLDYVTQYWEYKSSLSEASTVSVTAGSIKAGIDAELNEGGRITGRVTNASTGAGLEEVLVCVLTESGKLVSFRQCAITGANGEYTISAVGSGNYKIGFDAGKEYVSQYYNGKSSPAEANTVLVTAPATTPNIDAAMQTVGTPPANTTPPVVSGTPAVGSTLLCAPGLWTGKPAPTFSYQWLRGGAPIAGANATGYTVQSADAGNSLSCQITAKNAKGEKSARSASVAIPANPVIPPPPPAPKPVLTITGSKVVVSGRSATVHIVCSDAACAGSAELTMQIVVKHRKGKKTVSRKETLVLAKGSYSLAAGKSGTLVLRLTAAGKTRLAHVKRHPLTVKLSVSVKGGKTTLESVRVS
jgi:hypothetical protein